MNSLKIYDNFLEVNTIYVANSKFDFNFSIDMDSTYFEKEFLKFICLYNKFFFNTKSESIETIFNSYPCELDEKTILYLKKLYDTTNSLNKKIHKQIIAEFLLSYKNSLETETYKKQLGQEKIRKYKGILYKIFDMKSFEINGEIFKDTIEFYKNIIKYSEKNKVNIRYSKRVQILSKFNIKQRNNNEYKQIFNYFISENKYLDKLIKYDYGIEKHLIQYKNVILNSIANSYSSESGLRVFEELIKHIEIGNNFIKEYINKYIHICNKLIEDAILKKYNFIQIIANIEQTLKELNKIKQSNIDNIYKDKLKECICQVLCVKRKILNDTEYVNEMLCEHSYKLEIPREKIENMNTDILNRFYRIYAYAKIDFDDMICQSIKSYSEHPLLYLATSISIDNNELYDISEKKENRSIFKKYFNNKGIEYINKNYKILRNVLERDYYEHMLKYTKKEFEFKIGLISEVLYIDIEKIKNDIYFARIGDKVLNNNLYIEMVTQ
ncbi:MAG: hypothetical protein HFJ46_01405, partial [Clostridia bacterium]|nr:hypothetical protein [Clostridia bacterium]